MTLPTQSVSEQDLDARLRHIRHHIHQHPELAFQEHATADYVAGILRSQGYEVSTGIAGTGIVATLRSGSGAGSIGLRADMDALPIHEQTGLQYASRNDGKMHACGHDGHTAMLIGAAHLIAQRRAFSGTVHLIFQPAEERGFDSGGKAMVDAGLFDRFPCDRIFAMHNHPGLAQGNFMARPGPFMAAGDRVFVTIQGVGGHAARPHQTHDPLVAAAATVMSLQTIVSRNIDPQECAVVSVGRLQAGAALNVIPDSAEIGISVRSFSEVVRARLRERILAIVDTTARGYETLAKVDYREGYPVLVNDAAQMDTALDVAEELVGPERVDRCCERQVGSEDFGYMLQKCPGALIRIGNGPAAASARLHNPKYDFNDDNLLLGARFWERLVTRCLPVSSADLPDPWPTPGGMGR